MAALGANLNSTRIIGPALMQGRSQDLDWSPERTN